MKKRTDIPKPTKARTGKKPAARSARKTGGKPTRARPSAPTPIPAQADIRALAGAGAKNPGRKKPARKAKKPPVKSSKPVKPAAPAVDENGYTAEENAQFDLFIAALEAGDRHKEALTLAGLEWRAVSLRFTQDPGFQERYDTARKMGERIKSMKADDSVEERGVDGWVEPKFHAGLQCGTVRRFSDRCLELLLRKVGDPRYVQRVAVEGQLDGKFEVVSNTPLPDPPPDEG